MHIDGFIKYSKYVSLKDVMNAVDINDPRTDRTSFQIHSFNLWEFKKDWINYIRLCTEESFTYSYLIQIMDLLLKFECAWYDSKITFKDSFLTSMWIICLGSYEHLPTLHLYCLGTLIAINLAISLTKTTEFMMTPEELDTNLGHFDKYSRYIDKIDGCFDLSITNFEFVNTAIYSRLVRLRLWIKCLIAFSEHDFNHGLIFLKNTCKQIDIISQTYTMPNDFPDEKLFFNPNYPLMFGFKLSDRLYYEFFRSKARLCYFDTLTFFFEIIFNRIDDVNQIFIPKLLFSYFSVSGVILSRSILSQLFNHLHCNDNHYLCFLSDLKYFIYTSSKKFIYFLSFLEYFDQFQNPPSLLYASHIACNLIITAMQLKLIFTKADFSEALYLFNYFFNIKSYYIKKSHAVFESNFSNQFILNTKKTRNALWKSLYKFLSQYAFEYHLPLPYLISIEESKILLKRIGQQFIINNDEII